MTEQKFMAKVFHPTTYKLLHEESGFKDYEAAMKWVLKVTDNIIGSVILDIRKQEK